MREHIQVQDHVIGLAQPCFVVAEIGINHNGDLDLARRMIEAAADAGADGVKFQNYRTEDFISDRSLTYDYLSQGHRISEAQYDLFKRCELDLPSLQQLKAHCDRCAVVFHSTPTSAQGIADLLALEAAVLKNGSDYLTHLPLITAMGRTGLPTVISTGMSECDEIQRAVEAFRSTGNDQLILLHCTSSYPTRPEDVHLRKMQRLAERFDVLVGFSDHSEGVTAALGAVSLGACWIEKHFTISKDLPGPDQRFSADPSEFASLVDATRSMERYLGTATLGPTKQEDAARRAFRLSCVAVRAMKSGQAVDPECIAFRRPGTGMPPRQAERLVGRTLRHDVEPGHVFAIEDVR